MCSFKLWLTYYGDWGWERGTGKNLFSFFGNCKAAAANWTGAEETGGICTIPCNDWIIHNSRWHPFDRWSHAPGRGVSSTAIRCFSESHIIYSSYYHKHSKKIILSLLLSHGFTHSSATSCRSCTLKSDRTVMSLRFTNRYIIILLKISIIHMDLPSSSQDMDSKLAPYNIQLCREINKTKGY